MSETLRTELAIEARGFALGVSALGVRVHDRNLVHPQPGSRGNSQAAPAEDAAGQRA